ncbi:MAG: gamma-butyrobetaine hydroxylase-like domain-containing protein [Wenzhouxiangellaceae bacterium]|nr:gamma-butyrobetaine hydroxylase-like domain-containing protein [Wenzhouxiangellaceae bacterium]
MTAPDLVDLEISRSRRVVIATFADGARFELPFEYLRTHSPSAEVRGHGLAEPKLVTGKENVGIERAEPVGNYAVALHFDDGHSSGLYSWSFLHELGVNMERNLARWHERLEERG